MVVGRPSSGDVLVPTPEADADEQPTDARRVGGGPGGGLNTCVGGGPGGGLNDCGGGGPGGGLNDCDKGRPEGAANDCARTCGGGSEGGKYGIDCDCILV